MTRYDVGSSATERYDRAMARKRLTCENDQTGSEENMEEDQCNENQCCVAVQTDLGTQDIQKLQSDLDDMKEENAQLHSVIKDLKHQVMELTLDEAALKGNNEKVLFLTGLSCWELLHTLFIYVKPFMKSRSLLTPFQQLLVTLMRLRLNLSGQDLAYRFKVHSSTISRTFISVLDVLYTKLSGHSSYGLIERVLRKLCP